MASVAWSGVFPAVTTQFHADLSVDLPATQREIEALIADGVDGLIMLGTCGENNSLTAEEKRHVLQAAKEAAAGRVPVLSGVSEFTTAAAADHARAAEKIGIDGLMLLPAMVYAPIEAELEQHFRTVLGASGLPVMAYNNPPAYRAELSLETLQRLADCPTLVAIKEAATDTRRYTDIINATGDRYVLFAGLDDMALEGLMLGATGWVSGFSNVFPAESRAIYTLARAGRYTEALPLYRWFMPVLHMDGWHTLVQCIKLSEAMVGRELNASVRRATILPVRSAPRWRRSCAPHLKHGPISRQSPRPDRLGTWTRMSSLSAVELPASAPPMRLALLAACSCWSAKRSPATTQRGVPPRCSRSAWAAVRRGR